MDAGEAGDFAANDLEDFSAGEPRHEEAEDAEGGVALKIGADVGAGAGAALDEAAAFEIAQGAGDSGARHAELPDQLHFAGEPRTLAKAAGGDFGLQVTADFLVLGLGVHAGPFPPRGEAGINRL